MTYYQYKFIKRLTKTISVFCFIVVSLYTIVAFSSREILATESCSGSVLMSPNGDLSDVNIYNSASFTFKPGFSLLQSYSAQIWYKKNDSSIVPSAFGGLLTDLTGDQTRSINFDSTGSYDFYATYTPQGCSQKETNHLTAIVTNDITGGSDSTNISINAPGKVLRNETITIKMTVSGAKNQNVILYINKGGSDCPDTSTTESCWVAKMESIANEDPWYHETDWTPDLSSNLGNHMIKVKTYLISSTGPNILTGMATTNINVCEADSASCASGTGDGTGSTVTGPSVDVAETVTVDGIKFTLNRGSGVGGLVNLIINLLATLVGAASFISLLVAGIQYITAGGDSTKTDKAKKTMIYSTVAMVLAVLSLIIFDVINKLLQTS